MSINDAEQIFLGFGEFTGGQEAVIRCAATELLKVLLELKGCSSYWSEYDVPIGIHNRIDNALTLAGIEL